MTGAEAPRPSRRQIDATSAVVRWYLRLYFDTPHDPGVTARFCDPAVVGAWAVDAAALRAGDPDALFRLLVATTMFQRRQDQQILRILRATPLAAVQDLSDPRLLLAGAELSGCPALASNDALLGTCDLTKDATTKLGVCTHRPTIPCRPKEHTVWLKRYGHFGKVPTSAALVVRESGAGDLRGLYERTLRVHRTRGQRSAALEAELSRAWRINQKIACMFLSAISNPDLARGLAPWAEGLDWRQFVVIDSNVDLFLKAVGYRGGSSYDARRAFIRSLAGEIDLRAEGGRTHADNPRIVQQAMFVFMSEANRRASLNDCSHARPLSCRRCPENLSRRCSLALGRT
jgi:hypothetical protein